MPPLYPPSTVLPPHHSPPSLTPAPSPLRVADVLFYLPNVTGLAFVRVCSLEHQPGTTGGQKESDALPAQSSNLPPERRRRTSQPIRASGRRFQNHWKGTFKWLRYDQTRDAAFCQICEDAYKEGLLHSQTRMELAFIDKGFQN